MSPEQLEQPRLKRENIAVALLLSITVAVAVVDVKLPLPRPKRFRLELRAWNDFEFWEYTRLNRFLRWICRILTDP